MFAGESLNCHPGTVAGNADVTGSSGEISERMEGSCRESLHLLREHRNRMLVEIRTSQAILVRSQAERRNRLLENRSLL